jgi:hypothetical protein
MSLPNIGKEYLSNNGESVPKKRGPLQKKRETLVSRRSILEFYLIYTIKKRGLMVFIMTS